MTAAPMAISSHSHWAINSPYTPNMIPRAAKVLDPIFQTLENPHRRTASILVSQPVVGSVGAHKHTKRLRARRRAMAIEVFSEPMSTGKDLC